MLRAIVIAFVAAFALAACSNGSTTAPPAAGGTSSSSSGGTASGATVQISNSSQFGPILTDAQGNTLYLFEQDSGTTTACTGACSGIWPALTAASSPKAGSGLDPSLLGTAKQADGTTQVTYNGHLLYYYAGDSAPGDTNGEGINGFFVVSSAGDKVAAPMSGASSSSGSSAYHY